LSSDLGWSVRTKVINTALAAMKFDSAISDRIKGDIDLKYGKFKCFEDLRRWIHDLPEYYKEFGSKLEPFIISVLNGVKEFCPSLEVDCEEVLEELGIGLDLIRVEVHDAMSGEMLGGCLLRVRGKEYKFDGRFEIRVRVPSTIEICREGYEVFRAEVTEPGDHVVRLLPCEIDVVVNVMDELGPLPNAWIRVSPASFSGQAEEFLSNQNGSLNLKLLNNQLYDFEVFVGGESILKDTVRVDRKLINLHVKEVFCRLGVVFRRRREAQLKLFEDYRPEFLLDEFKVVIYDETGKELLGEGFNGSVIPLTRPIKPGERINIRAYPLDRHGRYMPHLYNLLKTFMEDQGIKLVEDQRILIEVDMDEAEEGLTLKFRNIELYKSLKKEGIPILEVDMEGRFPKTSGVSFGEYLEWDDDDKVKALFGGDGEAKRLYEHQHEALNELEEPDGRKCVIVSSGMASGKTEIAVLYLLKAYRLNPDFRYAVVVYPTRELLRDQYRRWKRYFEAAYDLGYLNSPVQVAFYYGEIAKQSEGSRELEKIKAGRCVILTTASTFCSQGFLNLLKQPPIVVVLDEIHFYRSSDLTLIMEFLRFAIQNLGGFEKIMMFSATIGNADEFKARVRNALNISCRLIPGESVRGRKTIYAVDLSGLDERHQESLVDGVLREYCRKSEDKTIIFARNRTEAEGYCYRKSLRKWGAKAVLHIGDMSMAERRAAARMFRVGRCKWIVTVKTLEVGIDIGDVSRIIHLGLPPSLSEFIQREGRSGRQGQESESIIFARTKGDFEKAKAWIEELKAGASELLCKVIFNPQSLLATKIRDEVRKSGKWPEKVSIEGLAVKCKVFGGSRFKLMLPLGLKGRGEVYTRDIIFRYLPYSIRYRHGRKLYVKKIDIKDSNKDRNIVLDLIENNHEVWSLANRRDFYATTAWVETIVKEVSRPLLSDLDTAKVRLKPLCVNYVGMDTQKIFRDGKIVEVPRYYIIKSFPVPDEVAANLEKLSEEFTRGFIVDFEVPKDLIFEITKRVVEERGADAERIIREVLWRIEGYLHLALHALINVVVQGERIHPEEIEHYVYRRVSEDEMLRSEIVRQLASDWRIDKVRLLIEELSPKIGIKIVVGNKTDLLKNINWRDGLEEHLNELFKADQETIRLFLELPNCFVIPESVPGLFEDFDKMKSIICDLAHKILGRIQDRADKLTVY